MNTLSRRHLLQTAAAAGAAALLPEGFAQDVVKVGNLHSLTGTIALAEASVVDAEMLAIAMRCPA